MAEVLPILDYQMEVTEMPSQSGDDVLFDDSLDEETTVTDYYHTGKDFSQNYGKLTILFSFICQLYILLSELISFNGRLGVVNNLEDYTRGIIRFGQSQF